MGAKDIPFDQAMQQAEEIISKGGAVFQKFTCEHCGVRQTMDVPNTFYTSGRCQECDKVTDIKSRGCGFLVALTI